MGKISTWRSSEPDLVENLYCNLCGEKMEHGGWYNGAEDIVICSNCILHGDTNAMGIAIGDAILDVYERGRPAEIGKYPPTLVDDFLERLKSRIYQAIAVGLYQKVVRRENNTIP
jgi:hypothetical protein